MPVHTFELRDGSRPVEDGSGIILLDRDHALAYARHFVLELMTCHELQTRSWRKGVRNSVRQCRSLA
jgi:hypothetical protein